MPAAFCPWQSTLWAALDLDDIELTVAIADAAVAADLHDPSALNYFRDQAPAAVKKLTSPYALVAPVRRSPTDRMSWPWPTEEPARKSDQAAC